MSCCIYNDGTYCAHFPGWHSRDSEWKSAHLFSLLDEDSLREMRQRVMTIAEIGCGFGGVLADLVLRLEKAGVCCAATGYDIARDAIAEAAKRYPRHRFIHGEFASHNEKYDLGLFVDVIEHLDNPGAFLKEVTQCFRWVLLHIPLDENWFGRAYRPGWYYQFLRKDRGHLHYFTKTSALRFLTEVGLRIVAWKYTFKSVELQGMGAGKIAPFLKLGRSISYRLFPDMGVRFLGGASLACYCTVMPVGRRQ
jgi:SAM-dependent methyltransferase